MILAKVHLRIFPCREGVYSCLWPEEINISGIKNLIVSTVIIFTAVGITVLSDEEGVLFGKPGMQYYNVLEDGLTYFIDLLV